MIPFNINQRKSFIPARNPLAQSNNYNPFGQNIRQSGGFPTDTNSAANPFGLNIPLGQPPPVNPQPATQQPINQPAPEQDFMAQYNKLSQPGANRLAYKEAVDAGTPQINRSKWARLGAAIAAGGAGLGGTPAAQAAQFGISSYYAPQERANEEYAKKVHGLSNLAELEDKDRDRSMKALDFQRNEYWKGKEFDRQGKMTDAQIANWQADNDRQNWDKVTNPKTGNTELVNRVTGVRKDLGQTTLSTAEDLQLAIDKASAEEKVKEPYRVAARKDARQQANEVASIGASSRENVAGIGATSRENVAQTAAASKAAALEQRKTEFLEKNPAAKEQYQRALVAGNQAVLSANANSNPELQGIDINDYLDIDDVTGMVNVVKPRFSGSQQAADTLRRIIGGGMNRNAGRNTGANVVQPSNQPASQPPPSTQSSGWGTPIVR